MTYSDAHSKPTFIPATALAASAAVEVAASPVAAIRTSIHRANAIRLPTDAMEAAALVLAYVQAGDDKYERSAAIEGMVERVDKLKGSDGAQAEEELLAHAAVLDGLFSRYTVEAMVARMPDHRVKFQKLALNCQSSYTRTVIAVEALRAQRRGVGILTISDNQSDANT